MLWLVPLVKCTGLGASMFLQETPLSGDRPVLRRWRSPSFLPAFPTELLSICTCFVVCIRSVAGSRPSDGAGGARR